MVISRNGSKSRKPPRPPIYPLAMWLLPYLPEQFTVRQFITLADKHFRGDPINYHHARNALGLLVAAKKLRQLRSPAPGKKALYKKLGK